MTTHALHLQTPTNWWDLARFSEHVMHRPRSPPIFSSFEHALVVVHTEAFIVRHQSPGDLDRVRAGEIARNAALRSPRGQPPHHPSTHGMCLTALWPGILVHILHSGCAWYR
jgi:hypothetical protein